MSGHTERGRERERERDFEAIESGAETFLYKRQISYIIKSSSATPRLHYIPAIITTPSVAIAAHTFISTPRLSRMASPFVTNMFKIPADPPMFLFFRSSISEPVDGAAVCVCLCVCVRARA